MRNIIITSLLLVQAATTSSFSAFTELGFEKNPIIIDSACNPRYQEQPTLIPIMEIVRIVQKSQENGQNRTNTDTGMDRVHKSQKFLAKEFPIKLQPIDSNFWTKDHPLDKLLCDHPSLMDSVNSYIPILRENIVVGIKSRLWPKGYKQVDGIDFDGVICSVARLEAVRRYDCKSTSGGVQFLGGKLCELGVQRNNDCRQMSTAEAEYVSLSACCAQVIWMRIQLLDYGFK
ncbi:hypothetical protein Tco_1525593 [Tanacetum coccineum]